MERNAVRVENIRTRRGDSPYPRITGVRALLSLRTSLLFVAVFLRSKAMSLSLREIIIYRPKLCFDCYNSKKMSSLLKLPILDRILINL